MTSLPQIDDLHLPAAVELTGEGIGDRLAALVGDGSRMLGWRPANVTYHPGWGLLVRYEVEVRAGDGRTRTERIIAACGGFLPAGDPDDVAVWRQVDDPALPGLSAALDPSSVRQLFDDLGAPPGPVRLRLRVHRPQRRAVVEAVTPHVRLFLRVVPPRKARAIHDLHRRLEEAGLPVPPAHGWSSTLGIVVLGALGGDDLRARLKKGDGPFPQPEDIADLIGSLPPDIARNQRRGWRHRRHREVISSVRPETAPALDELVERLDVAEQRVSQGPPVPVHGDLHEGQLRADGARIVGLLDVETVGAGARVDDVGNLVGHLSALATSVPRPGAILDYAGRLLGSCLAAEDPEDLRAAVAATILGLATGPFRVQQKDWRSATDERVRLAARWLRSPHMSDLSAAPHRLHRSLEHVGDAAPKEMT